MIKCRWCPKDAETKTYREIDEVVGSSIECLDCASLKSSYLIQRRYKNENNL
jgi:hypothetical protein